MLRTLLCTLMVTLVAASPAAADSIAYIHKGDIWLATPDGARRVQVTHTGTYFNVSQADDGTMIALAPGERLHKISRDGTVLADFLTPISDGAPQSGPINKFHGPFNPQISPDATKVAYEYFNDTYEDDPSCSATSVPPCFAYRQSQGTLISSSDGYTGFQTYGLLTGWIYPVWLDNTTLIRSDPGTLNDDAVFTNLGGHPADRWFYDSHMGLGVVAIDLSHDRSTVVGIAGFNDEKLRVYRTVLDPFTVPDWDHTPFTNTVQRQSADQCFELTGKFKSTSLAPSGSALAYGTPDGVYVTPIAGDCTLTPKLLALDASSPDWGPADVPSAMGQQQPQSNPVKPTTRPPRLKLAGRNGVTATLITGTPGKATLTATLKGRKVKRNLTIGTSGRGSVSFRLRKRGTVTVRATFKSQTVTAKLKR